MTQSDIECLARRLYERERVVCPTWEQIGDTTRSVWRERAVQVAAGSDPLGVRLNSDGELSQGKDAVPVGGSVQGEARVDTAQKKLEETAMRQGTLF